MSEFKVTADLDMPENGSLYLQFDGNDLVSVTDYDPDSGSAIVTVHASTDENADALFTGQVNLHAHVSEPS